MQVGKAMFEASNWIAGRLGCVTASDFDSVIVKRVAQSEPISRGVMLQVEMRRFFRRRTGVSGTGGESRIGEERETDQHNDRMGARVHCPSRSPLASHGHMFPPPGPA